MKKALVKAKPRTLAVVPRRINPQYLERREREHQEALEEQRRQWEREQWERQELERRQQLPPQVVYVQPPPSHYRVEPDLVEAHREALRRLEPPTDFPVNTKQSVSVTTHIEYRNEEIKTMTQDAADFMGACLIMGIPFLVIIAWFLGLWR